MYGLPELRNMMSKHKNIYTKKYADPKHARKAHELARKRKLKKVKK